MRSKETGRFESTHGMYGTRLYHIWSGFKGRCLNEKSRDYSDYGGRGITICEEWHNPNNFFKWALSNGYDDDLTIDRIDNSKGYSPDNCRWITNAKQQRNKRSNVVIEYCGEKHCVAEWAEIINVKQKTIYERVKRGWSAKEIITTPTLKNERLKHETDM